MPGICPYWNGYTHSQADAGIFGSSAYTHSIIFY
jgi:hypothetical protein